MGHVGYRPGVYFHIQEVRGGASTWPLIWRQNLGQGRQIRGKAWEVLVPQEVKIETESQFWGIQKEKFGAFVTYSFGGKNLRL